MSSEQSFGNAPAPLKLCLCGNLYKPTQDQASTYCNDCFQIMASQTEGLPLVPLASRGVPTDHYQQDLTQEPLAQGPGSPQAWSQRSSADSVASSTSPGYYGSHTRPQNHPSLAQSINYSAPDFGTPSDSTLRVALPQLYTSTGVDPPVPQPVPSSPDMRRYGSPTRAMMPAPRQVASQSIKKAAEIRRTQDALFQCPLADCGATFTRESSLEHHLNSHYGLKPFACRWAGCNSAFGRPYDRTRHEIKCSFRDSE